MEDLRTAGSGQGLQSIQKYPRHVKAALRDSFVGSG
jgi:hypothetical protein